MHALMQVMAHQRIRPASTTIRERSFRGASELPAIASSLQNWHGRIPPCTRKCEQQPYNEGCLRQRCATSVSVSRKARNKVRCDSKRSAGRSLREGFVRPTYFSTSASVHSGAPSGHGERVKARSPYTLANERAGAIILPRSQTARAGVR